ncbi:MAG: hypothetical protein JKY67_21890 [Pseudomonadales bacterium]|nr:hypothetical protein [Pseudomonadales bacterium]
MIWITLFILVFGAVGFAYYRSRSEPTHKRKKRRITNSKVPPRSAEKHQGNSIQCTNNACDAVKQLAEKRFLVKDTPSLPVSGCDSENCECRYVHFDDRREKTEDRRSTFGLKTILHEETGKNENRVKPRRKEDN